jgi:hypothetical protein|tara:strand:+ start:1243 stop:1962 length:720 start_codon:yes stop_codon:yes gene_type:complete
MTLAVQLSGQIRYWNQSYKYWKKFKKYFNDNGIEVDFFLSCWDKEGKQYDYNSTGNLVNIDKSFFKDTNIETQNIKFDKKVSFDGSPLEPSFWCMCHHFAESTFIRLKYEKKIKKNYDCVLISRPDLIFSKGTLKTFLNIFKGVNTEVYLDNRGVFTSIGAVARPSNKKKSVPLYVEDKFILGNRVPMNLFLMIEDYYNVNLIQRGAHAFLSTFLEKMNMYNWPISIDNQQLKLQRDLI